MSIDEFLLMCDMKNITKIVILSGKTNIISLCKKLKFKKIAFKSEHYNKQTVYIADVKMLPNIVPGDIELKKIDHEWCQPFEYANYDYGIDIASNLTIIKNGLYHEKELLMKRVNAIDEGLVAMGETI